MIKLFTLNGSWGRGYTSGFYQSMNTVEKQPFEVVLLKKVSLKISQNSQETICVRVYFLIKLQVWGLQLY